MQFVDFLQKCGGHPYLLDLDDFMHIPDLIKKADGVVIYPSSEIPPDYYGESNKQSVLSKESHTIFIFNKSMIDQSPPH